jgi:hypothetical protein
VSGIVDRLRSLSIATQIAMLVAAALVIAHVLIGAVVFALYLRPDPMSFPEAAIFRLCFVAKLLDAASSPDLRVEILGIAHKEIPDLVVGEPPQSVRSALLLPYPEDVQSCVGDGFKVFDIAPDELGGRPRFAIQLPDGSAVMAPFGPPPPFPLPGPDLTIAIVFLVSAVILLSIRAARRRRLRDLPRL